ncbi:MAG TPA: cytochrome c-type biogenesis protein [Candidatus Methylomirabilis sp.]|nr:cytochrome c-type biogenesis protein [Candidatus Methylomirabilis sp.]
MNRLLFYLRVSVCICGLAFLVAPTFAEQVTEDPVERQMLDIAKDLRCTVCQNQPVSESNADLAHDMRNIIREQIKAGKSRQEIIQYFVDRYGDYVLMKPPKSGAGEVVWLAPVVLLAIVGVTGFLFLRHRLRPSLPPPPKLSKEDAARVRAAREQSQT